VRIIVIGAGIAGLTTAIALRKAGIDTQVYEEATRLRGSVPVSRSQLMPNARSRYWRSPATCVPRAVSESEASSEDRTAAFSLQFPPMNSASL
jgi:2-polyprenyl-6-methoxyphenol hydroxylase-like FAD-dependent oxidoreductase